MRRRNKINKEMEIILSPKDLRPRIIPLVENNNRFLIMIKPTIDGFPTIYDADMIIFIISGIRYLMSCGVKFDPAVPQFIEFFISDFLKTVGKSDAGPNYTRAFETLTMLSGALFTMKSPSDDDAFDEGKSFQLFRDVHYKERKSNGRVEVVKIRLCEWIWRIAVEGKDLLPIHPGYFALSPMQRTLYLYARKCCHEGRGAHNIGIDKLYSKIGPGSIDVNPKKIKIKRSSDANDKFEWCRQVKDLCGESGNIHILNYSFKYDDTEKKLSIRSDKRIKMDAVSDQTVAVMKQMNAGEIDVETAHQALADI
jgi:hypothetical protein